MSDSHPLRTTLLQHRLPLVVVAHLLLIPISNYISFWLRFDGVIPRQFMNLMWQMLPWLVIIRAIIFLTNRLYHGLWRYTGIWDLWRIVSATVLGTVLFYLLTHTVLGIKAYPRSIFVIDSILQIFLLSAIRLPWRIHRELKRSAKKGKRVIIYGAGDAGEMIVRDMKVHPEYNYDPVGFLDDSSRKVGQSIHGIPVLGTRKSMANVIRDYSIEEVIVAIPSADPPVLREILKQLEPFNIPIKTTPNLRDILDGKVKISQIRNLAVEDLLVRMPVNLDLSAVSQMLKGKRVLVTGAGGSIGSELCRQIVKLEVSELFLLERYENGLYEITQELERMGYKNCIRPFIADVTDKRRIKRIFKDYRPELVFHAAAHKHVPLMESNPCEAIKNNVTGTRLLASAALRFGVGKFVFISTDKAVHPTSIMGASKRIAEMIVNSMANRGNTTFVTVRFGNVLASKGSVVPLFQDQIRRGGPVTITHPNMKRYFMLIPEAVQLVLISGAMPVHGTTYVLQMGEQIEVLEMARNIIRLSGFIPETEIPIVYSGLRPGEKLFEELVAEDEVAEPSDIPEILRIRQLHVPDRRTFRNTVRCLETAAFHHDLPKVIFHLKSLITAFQPEPNHTPLLQEAVPSVVQKP